jgi:hypothetical protein
MKASVPEFRAMSIGSLVTRRWREVDSNPRSHHNGNAFRSARQILYASLATTQASALADGDRCETASDRDPAPIPDKRLM